MNVFELFASISLDTKPFQNGLSNAANMASSAGSKVAGGLATIGKMGAAAVGAASTAMGAFAVSAVHAGQDFDSAMSQVAATSGKTMEEMANEVGEVDTQWGKFSGNLRDYAQFMGSKTAFSATQAAEALNYMALAGYDAQESMNMLPNVLNLAASGGMDLATASDMVTDAQSALGLTAEETTVMVDQMAKTASTTNTSVSQLGSAMLVIGATARNVKGGTAELSQVLGLLADNGIKSAEGGTHLRNMLLSLQNPTTEGAEALQELGVAVYDAEGNMRALPDIFQDLNRGMEGMSQASKDAMTSAIFNKTDLAAANALLGTNAERWDEVAVAISEAKGSAGEMADTQLDNLAGDITLFKSALEGAQIVVSDVLTPSLRDFVKFGTDGLSKLTDGFKEGGLTGAMEVFGTVLSDGLAMIIGKVPDFINAGMQLLGALAQGIRDNFLEITFAIGDTMEMVFDAVLKATDGGNIVTDIIADILGSLSENYLGLVDVGFQIINNIITGITEALPDIVHYAGWIIEFFIKSFTENIPQIATSAAELISTLASGMAERLHYLIPAAVEAVLTLVEAIIDNIDLFVDAAIQIAVALGEGLIAAVPVLLEKVPEIISKLSNAFTVDDGLLATGGEILSKIVSGITENIPELISVGMNALMALSQSLRENFGLIIDMGLEIILALAEGLIAALPVMIETIPTIISNIAGLINDNAPKLLSTGVQLIVMLVKGIIDAIPVIVKELPKIVKAIWDVIMAVNWVNLGSSIITAIKNGITKLASSIPGVFRDIVSKVTGLITSTNWASIGSGIVTKLTTGITGLIGKIPELFKSMVNKAVGFITSVNWVELAVNVVKGIAEGLTGAVSIAWDAIKAVAQGIIDGFRSILGINSPSTVFSGLAGDIISGLVDGLLNGIKAVTDAVGKIGGAIKDKFMSAVEGAKNWGKDLIDNFKGGISEKAESVKKTVSGVASKVKKLIGFSEPEEGPLSNFHTYAPDMMKLFAQGIRDNEKIVTDQIAESFNFGDMAVAPSLAMAGGGSMGYDQNTLIAALTQAMQGMSVQVMIGQDRIDDMVRKSIQRYNFKSGGR